MSTPKQSFFGIFHTLGDILTVTSIVHAIKEKYPDNLITFCTSKEYQDVVSFNPDIAEIVTVSHPQEILVVAGAWL